MTAGTGVPVNSSFAVIVTSAQKNVQEMQSYGELWTLHAYRDELLNAYKCKKTVIERGKVFDITEGSCGVCIVVCP